MMISPIAFSHPFYIYPSREAAAQAHGQQYTHDTARADGAGMCSSFRRKHTRARTQQQQQQQQHLLSITTSSRKYKTQDIHTSIAACAQCLCLGPLGLEQIAQAFGCALIPRAAFSLVAHPVSHCTHIGAGSSACRPRPLESTAERYPLAKRQNSRRVLLHMCSCVHA
jgi:hypothetical protein